MQNLESFGKLIKDELKRQVITQEEFAKIMKTSVPTIKRWLKGEGVLLRDWIKMLDCLGLSFAEAIMAIEASSTKVFTYTIEQERLLSTEDGLLAFFDHLLKGKTPAQIARQFSLTQESVIFYLSKLDKVSLVEWLPKNKVKLLVNGEPHWIKMGPLSRKFRKQIIQSHIENYIDDRDHLKVNIYSLSEESLLKLFSIMGEYSDKIRSLEIKDAQKQETKKLTTVIFGHGYNDIAILTKIPNRKYKECFPRI
jgi:transcriptional regulator with XRE-family HTH domain